MNKANFSNRNNRYRSNDRQYNQNQYNSQNRYYSTDNYIGNNCNMYDTNTVYILYVMGCPVSMFLNKNVAFNYLEDFAERVKNCNDFNLFKTSSRSSTGLVDMHVFTSNKSHECTEHIIYSYDFTNNSVVAFKPIYMKPFSLFGGNQGLNSIQQNRYSGSNFSSNTSHPSSFGAEYLSGGRGFQGSYIFQDAISTRAHIETFEPNRLNPNRYSNKQNNHPVNSECVRDKTKFNRTRGNGSNNNYRNNTYHTNVKQIKCQQQSNRPLNQSPDQTPEQTPEQTLKQTPVQSSDQSPNQSLQSRRSNNELKSEMIKLTQLLSNVSSPASDSSRNTRLNMHGNPTGNNPVKTAEKTLEEIYKGVQEEAEIDADIQNTKRKLDRACGRKKKQTFADEIAFSDDENSNDDENNLSDDLRTSDHNSDTDGENSQNMTLIPPLLTDSMYDTEEISELIKMRNSMSTEFNKEKLVVDKANELLNEDIFNKRCEKQKADRQKKIQEEMISIFVSDKNTYLKMRSKIREGTLKESNVSPIFNFKFQIIKYMENNNVVSFKNNANVIEEQHIFEQLQKVINGLEYEEYMCDSADSDSDCHNPMDDIDENYLPLCEKFLDIVANSEKQILSDKKVHTILNENPDIKKGLFGEVADHTVFEKDIDKEEYKRIEELEAQYKNNNRHDNRQR